MEWIVSIIWGQVELMAHFKNGGMTENGSHPATYTTENAACQQVIENSDYFKKGKIKLLRTVEVADKESIRPIVAKTRTVEKQTEKPSAKRQEVAEEERPKTVASDAETKEETESGVETVQVADKKDAIEWLKAHYPEKGYNGTTLRSNASFEEACAEHKVKFEYAE